MKVKQIFQLSLVFILLASIFNVAAQPLGVMGDLQLEVGEVAIVPLENPGAAVQPGDDLVCTIMTTDVVFYPFVYRWYKDGARIFNNEGTDPSLLVGEYVTAGHKYSCEVYGESSDPESPIPDRDFLGDAFVILPTDPNAPTDGRPEDDFDNNIVEVTWESEGQKLTVQSGEIPTTDNDLTCNVIGQDNEQFYFDWTKNNEVMWQGTGLQGANVLTADKTKPGDVWTCNAYLETSDPDFPIPDRDLIGSQRISIKDDPATHEVKITPENPTTEQDMVCSAENGENYRWEETDGRKKVNGDTVSHVLTHPGEEWTCKVDIDGDTFSHSVYVNSIKDEDGDRVSDIMSPTGEKDNCLIEFNPDQADFDGDGVGDACDDPIQLELESFTAAKSELTAGEEQTIDVKIVAQGKTVKEPVEGVDVSLYKADGTLFADKQKTNEYGAVSFVKTIEEAGAYELYFVAEKEHFLPITKSDTTVTFDVLTPEGVKVLSDAPVLAITAPAANSEFFVGDEVTFTFKTTDDDDTLRYTVSDDKGVMYAENFEAGKDYSLTHVYSEVGTYVITAVVADPDEQTDTKTVTIVIKEAAPINEAPIVAIDYPGEGANKFLVGADIEVAATITDAGDGPFDYTITTGDGQTLTGVTNTKQIRHSVNYAAAGTFTLSLTVSDGELTGSDNVGIEIWEHHFDIIGLASYGSPTFDDPKTDYYRGEPLYISFTVVDKNDNNNNNKIINNINEVYMYNNANPGVRVNLGPYTGGVIVDGQNNPPTGQYYYALNEIPLADEYLGWTIVFVFSHDNGGAAQHQLGINILNNDLTIFDIPDQQSVDQNIVLDLTPFAQDVETPQEELIWSVAANSADPVIDAQYNSSDQTVTFMLADAGVYGSEQFTFTVSDDDGSVATDTATVTIIPGTFTVNIQADDTVGEAPFSVRFSVTTDSVDPIISYEWDMDGDGTIDVSGATPEYTFTEPGNYNVRVFVTDSVGRQGNDAILIVVRDKERSPGKDMMRVESINYPRGDFVEAGQESLVVVNVLNDGSGVFKDVKLTAIVHDLALRSVDGPEDVKPGDHRSYKAYLDIPSWAEPGIYPLRLTISSDDVKRVVYRDIIVE